MKPAQLLILIATALSIVSLTGNLVVKPPVAVPTDPVVVVPEIALPDQLTDEEWQELLLAIEQETDYAAT